MFEESTKKFKKKVNQKYVIREIHWLANPVNWSWLGSPGKCFKSVSPGCNLIRSAIVRVIFTELCTCNNTTWLYSSDITLADDDGLGLFWRHGQLGAGAGSGREVAVVAAVSWRDLTLVRRAFIRAWVRQHVSFHLAGSGIRDPKVTQYTGPLGPGPPL